MPNYKKLKNVVYHTTSYEHHTADVYLPLATENAPFVINVHGGAFQAGSKEMYAAWGPYLAECGIASMSINYTLTSPNRAAYPELINDMDAAINFAVKNAAEWNIDPMNMGFMGDSAGGYLGSMAAFQPQRSSANIRFVISAYGVMDIVDWYHYTNATRSDFVVNKLFGQDVYAGKELYESASPIKVIDKAVRNPLFNTAFYMIWGGTDEIVQPENQTLAFIEKLEEHSLTYEKYEVAELGHFWFTKNDESFGNKLSPVLNDEIAPKVVAFIQKHTKPTPIQPMRKI